MKLDELKTQIAEMFNNAEDKATIEQLAKINNTIDEAEAEQTALLEKHKELLTDYKEVIKHTSFSGKVEAAVPGSPEPISFEDALQTFMSNIDR